MRKMQFRAGLASLFLSLTLAITGITSSAHAVDYVDPAPMLERVKTAARDCRPPESLSVPMITWGADTIAINANKI